MDIFKKFAKDLEKHEHTYWMPGSFDLALWSKKYSIPNRDDVPTFHSRVRARNVSGTIDDVNKLGKTEQKKVEATIKKAFKMLWKEDMITVERNIGCHSKGAIKFRAFVPKKYPQLALMSYRNFFKAPEDVPVDFTTIMVPDFSEKHTFVDPENNVTVILGSDYYGELKMSLLRMAMNQAREKRRSLGIHAGSKVYWLFDKNKKLRKKGILIFGLSGTGKTTITTMGHGLKFPERVRMRQDDINIINEKTYCIGTERNFYVKTDSLLNQPELFNATTDPNAVIENVPVKYGGFAFDDIAFCDNGRAIIPRFGIPNTDALVDLEKVDTIFFNTRRYDIPVVGRLVSPEQAATFFMLGESTQTSAGTEDMSQVGKPIRVVGFDPFIIPPIYKNGQRFYEILKKNPHVKVYIVNTGKVGGITHGIKITPKVTGTSVLEIVRGTVKWKYDPNVGYDIPTEIPGIKVEKYDPYKIYDPGEYGSIMEGLREERIEYLKKFPELKFLKLTK